MATAVTLRFFQLGQLPPGLYRDEAYNGLDALGVLAGNHAFYFAGNNGREPLYIYLTAGAVALFGRSALAVRLGAAVIGSLTTLVTYKLAKEWFGRRVGLLSAWLWAITLWPVHLSRIGLRAILLPFFLGLAFWLGTLAYRRQDGRLWLLTGLVYGFSFYTYLAVRFTPVLLLLLAVYFFLTQRRKGAKGQRSRGAGGSPQSLVSSLLFFMLGTAVVLLPLIFLAWQDPDLILGRAGQVSIFDEEVNNGRFASTLWQHTGQALGMFFWQGDTILRHNPAGRPVFDLLMTLPFLIGVFWCVRHWRHWPAMTLLLWTTVMAGPTILAADTPHFLRAVGILPAVVIFPALGLAWVWEGGERGERGGVWGSLLVGVVIGGSLLLTILDYERYSHDPETAYLFEAAASDLAADISSQAVETVIFVDNRFWSGWPALPFLVDENQVVRFQGEDGFAGMAGRDTAVYAWPHRSLDYLAQSLPPPALIHSRSGSLARGDLEAQPYPLYVYYHARPAPDWPVVANFNNQLQLRQATLAPLPASQVQIDLYWSAETAVTQPLITFIHIIDANGLIAQDDEAPANGRWPWWQPGLIIHDQHIMNLPEPFNEDHQIIIGLYDANTQIRLPLTGTTADTWQLHP
jgi:4-amino-4-deoxy-L-arabinose transferase-like glycosyltransferase